MKNKALWMARLLYERGPLGKEDIKQAWREENPAGRPMANSTFYDNRRVLAERYGLRLEQRGTCLALAADGAADALYEKILGHHEAPEPRLSALALQVELEEAVRSRCKVAFTYHPPDKAAYAMTLCPYALRESGGRLYTIGLSERHAQVRIFALDRISALQPTRLKFNRPPHFDAAHYFAHIYGAMRPEGARPERVRLLTDAALRTYFEQRPLHPTQRLDTAADGRLLISMTVVPTRDFTSRLLSFGPKIEVLAPRALREEVASLLRRALQRYEDG